jgi:carbon-monoxide dehydrogenase large subunit
MPTNGNVFGLSLKRREDLPLLKGAGRYLDDITRPGLVHLGVVRSPHAHARVLRIEAGKARALAGVLGVFGPAELPEVARPIPLHMMSRQQFRPFEHPALARGKARYVGEPIAVVVADGAYRVRDALEAVHVEYEPLPAITSTVEALKSTARVHDEWPDNIAGVSTDGVGDLERGMAAADLVIAHELRHPRNAGMPIEPRGVLAYDDDGGVLVVYSSTQTTYLVREAISAVLGIDVERIRVIAPDVGGAFGAKAQVFPEEVLVPMLARRLGAPSSGWRRGTSTSYRPVTTANRCTRSGSASTRMGRSPPSTISSPPTSARIPSRARAFPSTRSIISVPRTRSPITAGAPTTS